MLPRYMPKPMKPILILLAILACSPTGSAMEWVRVDQGGKAFILSDSKRPFVPWGVNYGRTTKLFASVSC